MANKFPDSRLQFKHKFFVGTLKLWSPEPSLGHIGHKNGNFFTAPPGGQIHETKVDPNSKLSNFCFYIIKFSQTSKKLQPILEFC